METGGCHGFKIAPAVLECANCSVHAMVGGALSETVATVSLSAMPRLSLLYRQSCRLRVGKQTCGEGRAVSRHAFTQGSNDAVEVRGSFQETAPRKTSENTVKHRDGGVGLVVANHRGGGESLVVVTTL